MPDLQRYTWNRNMIKNVEDTHFYIKSVNFDDFSIAFYKPEKRKSLSQMKMNSFVKHKHWHKIHTWVDKAFKCAFVNRALPSLGGSLKLRLQSL